MLMLFLIASFLASGWTFSGHAADGTVRPEEPTSGVWIAQVVTDPQQDRDGSGKATVSDETVVLWNAGVTDVDLAGWSLVMEDSKRIVQSLDGTIAAGGRLVILNPDDQMNNDVALELLAPDGTIVDHVILGTDTADGDATDLLDEAVHLVGPWAGHKGPATGTRPLTVYWLERMEAVTGTGTLGANGHTLSAPAPFAPVWTTGNTTLTARLHAAPGKTMQNLSLVLDNGTAYSFEATQQGTWNMTIGPLDRDRSYRLEGPDGDVSEHPDATPFVLRYDATPPTIGTAPVIANATGHLHAYPTLDDDQAGLQAIRIDAVVNNTTTPLANCRPFGAPHVDCRVNDRNTTIRIHLLDAAGNIVSGERPVVFDSDPPVAPDLVTFRTGTPPTFDWTSFDEPLSRLEVETADDATGVWSHGRTALGGDAATYTDESWVPGEPRAYRLIGTDRAGNSAASEWFPLPPEAVPVDATSDDLDHAARVLARDGTVEVVVVFDRPMETAPELVFGTRKGRPFEVTAAGTLDPSARQATYVVEAPPGTPRSGNATWRLTGGSGEDGAPVAMFRHTSRWDLQAPRLDVEGAEPGWVRASRHVVVLSAHDGSEERPRVDVDKKPESAKVSGRIDARRVSLRGDGTHEIVGRVSDKAGNEAPFVVRVGLDATPPEVAWTTSDSWSTSQPFTVTLSDETSGLNMTSVRVWVRNATATAEGILEPQDGTVLVRPPSGTWAGPFELHVAVADHAGNLAEGAFGAVQTARVLPTQASTRSVHGFDGDPSGHAAPGARGPGWATASSGQGGTDSETARTAERLRADLQADNATGLIKTSGEDADGDGTESIAYGLIGTGGLLGTGLVVRGVRRRRQSAPPEVSRAGSKV